MIDATVEVGHTYAPNVLVPRSHTEGGVTFGDSLEATRLRRIASYFGESALRVALLDDVAMHAYGNRVSDQWRIEAAIAISAESLRHGVDARYVYRESTFERAGREIVDSIQGMDLPAGYRLSQDGRKLKLPNGVMSDTKVVQLQGFKGVEDPTYPSCEVLDTAWLQERLTLAPIAVTILRSDLAGQQERAAVIANLLGIPEESYRTVLYDPI